MTPAEIRQAADNWLSARWPTVVNRQNTYASNHNGRYWQGLITHGTIPIDAIESLADRLDEHPTDQSTTWNQAITGLPANWPCALQMHVYDGPDGTGFVGTVWIYVTQLGKLFARCQNVGPETYRTEPWHEIIPMPPPLP